MTLVTDAKMRKNIPMARGLLDYFPDALAEVAELSRIGNEQHNPGQPMHWAKEKSTDHADCIIRHLVDRGTIDTDKVRHSTKGAWRALALLQTEIENERELSIVPTLVGVADGVPTPPNSPNREPLPVREPERDLTKIPEVERREPMTADERWAYELNKTWSEAFPLVHRTTFCGCTDPCDHQFCPQRDMQ